MFEKTNHWRDVAWSCQNCALNDESCIRLVALVLVKVDISVPFVVLSGTAELHVVLVLNGNVLVAHLRCSLVTEAPQIWGGYVCQHFAGGDVCQFLAKDSAKSWQTSPLDQKYVNLYRKYIKMMTCASFEGRKMLANVPF